MNRDTSASTRPHRAVPRPVSHHRTVGLLSVRTKIGLCRSVPLLPSADFARSKTCEFPLPGVQPMAASKACVNRLQKEYRSLLKVCVPEAQLQCLPLGPS